MSTDFLFVPDITLEAYRKLWGGQLQQAKTRFQDLERTRGDGNVSNYLEDLNTFFELLTHAKDVRGSVWDEIHPDPDIRHEAGLAKRAFLELDIEVTTSASIASNLVILEKNPGTVLGVDSQTFLYEWQRDLRREGAFLSAEGREILCQLSLGVHSTGDNYLVHSCNDDSKLELGIDELQGVPGDYLISHSSNPITGKVNVRHRLADTEPSLQRCYFQAIR
ncbi:hypothetical protein QFC22_000884 [Naganishia vaughanmartiniae]|uniref:Uncharacterized protein n=1 Tax=Naganishia vaughanmartiniae TaxID=1424756 RepID=A0ACC2XJE0_9TREE|nr:hypothetical protein QFC22_000884 [Naganishia vaughanmartiniae]